MSKRSAGFLLTAICAFLAVLSSAQTSGPVGPPTPAAPVVTALYPPSAKAGTSNLLVFVTGQNFVRGFTTVQFHRSEGPSPVNGPARATVVFNSQVLAFQLTAADLAQAGVGMVSVVNRNPNGSFTASNQLPFAVLP